MYKCNCPECGLIREMREAYRNKDIEALYSFCKELWARLECAEVDLANEKFKRSQNNGRKTTFGFTNELVGIRHKIQIETELTDDEFCIHMEEIYEGIIMPLEYECGIHDVSYEKGEIWGYSTYEVETENAFQNLLSEWKEILSNIPTTKVIGDWYNERA